jgi:hypothetical protein
MVIFVIILQTSNVWFVSHTRSTFQQSEKKRSDNVDCSYAQSEKHIANNGQALPDGERKNRISKLLSSD